MKALIIASGVGTRFEKLTESKPKLLLESTQTTTYYLNIKRDKESWNNLLSSYTKSL